MFFDPEEGEGVVVVRRDRGTGEGQPCPCCCRRADGMEGQRDRWDST